MESENIKLLLNKISIITATAKVKEKEMQKRGENFNVFSTLGLSRSEVRLHSAFIAELLNPNGNHGLGTAFLKEFIIEIVPGFKFDPDSASVYVEYYIGPISEDYEEGGRLDILIKDQLSHAIVIENKIDAGDQPKQLLRYHHYMETTYKDNYVIIYLTKEGRRASEESIGKQEFDYTCRSYREHILHWLSRCIEISACYPLVRETIRQYITNLKQILYIMSDTENKQIVDSILASEDTLRAAYAIKDNISRANRRILHRIKIWQSELVEEIGLKDYNYNGHFDATQSGFGFGVKEWEHHYIKFTFGGKWFSNMWYGIVNENGEQSLTQEEIGLLIQRLPDMTTDSDKWWCIWQFPENPLYKDSWDSETFIDIQTTDNFKQFMKERIIKMIDAAKGLQNM